MISVLIMLLASTPITLQQVRELSRRQNSAAVLAEIAQQSAVEQVRGSRSAIYPQVYLSSSASGFISGRQRLFTTVPNPDGSGGFVQQSVDVAANSRGQFDTSLNFAQLLYDGGKWWNTIAQAGASARRQAG